MAEILRYQLKSIKLVCRYATAEAVFTFLVFIVSAIGLPLMVQYLGRIVTILSNVLVGAASIESAWMDTAIFVVLYILAKISLPFRNFAKVITGRRLMYTLADTVMAKLARLEYGAFEDPELHDTLNLMSDKPWDKLNEHFSATMSSLLYFSFLVGICIVIGGITPWLGVIVFALLIPQAYLRNRAVHAYNVLYEKQSGEERRLNYFNELLTNKESLYELRIFGAVKYILTQWRSKADVVFRERIRMALRAQMLFLCSNILAILSMGICFFITGAGIFHGTGSVGQLAMLVSSFYKLNGYSWHFAHNYIVAARKSKELRHFEAFLHLPERPEGTGAGLRDRCSIEFRDVSFSYPGRSEKVLDGLSFRIEAGEKIAIVGENGAGKSTVIKLLCRLYRPQSGQILLDGTDISQYSDGELSAMLGVVFQDYASYAVTLRENVAFGNIAKLQDDEALRSALREGLATDLEDELPRGLDSHLGRIEDDGVDLSGGQWQRVAIARACCAAAAFTILDEPTASLDPLAESEMYESFNRVLKTRGSIIISHRLGSARMADRILVLEGGRVSESGSHAKLMEGGGTYARMYSAQASWYQQ